MDPRERRDDPDRDRDGDPDRDPADEPEDAAPGLRWGTAANPNTADGEVQGVGAFARAAIHASGWRRTAARLAALVALVFLAVYLIAELVLATR